MRACAPESPTWLAFWFSLIFGFRVFGAGVLGFLGGYFGWLLGLVRCSLCAAVKRPSVSSPLFPQYLYHSISLIIMY